MNARLSAGFLITVEYCRIFLIEKINVFKAVYSHLFP